MELLIIIVLIILNGVFAMSELAVISARPVRLHGLAENGSSGAKAALRLKESPNRFLSTVQVGITLIGIMAGAFGGATVADQLASVLATIPALAANSQAIAFAIVIGITTYLSLVIGELVPKRLALQNPERIAVIVARPMAFLAQLAYPIVFVLGKSTSFVVRLLGVKPSSEPAVSEGEILSMMRQGIASGIFEPREHEMVEAVFRLGDQRAAAIVTPRTEILWLDIHATIDELRQIISDGQHSAYPVCHESMDHVVGIVRVNDLLLQLLRGDSLDLRAIMHKPLFIPENVSTGEILKRIKQSPVHVALIVDEHGGIEGMVTLHDLLEELAGEMDVDDPEIVQREDGSWLVDGTLTILRLESILPDFSVPEDEAGDYETVAGFIMTRLGHVPRLTDHFEWEGVFFEVVDMDGNRIDKVLISPIKRDHRVEK